MKGWRAAVVALVALSLAACTARVPGVPDAEVVRPSLTPTADQLPQAGQCTGAGLDVVDCTAEHEAEVTGVGVLEGLGAAYPNDRDLRRAALPACRAALTEYLGSPDHDATRLQAHALWPSRDGWAKGDRWRVCTVVELEPDGSRARRKTSAKDLLKAAGFGTVQLCATASPGEAKDAGITACDQPHKAEAVPGVLALGDHRDPTPSLDQVNAKAAEHCAKAVTNYVGAAREDVFASWRAFGSQAWSEGYTTAICYAEATRPFTGRLWGLGTTALPG
ncbi:septum formation family protein [Saccharothrix sp. 6-C]|uniref:septum formation family protein n=1 Tax=Saccharothrix sp. 6-C TaxID=2781735 RepID=UPI001916E372|nr:septum formation family protein [Saccharothrix sp. 6-C]QQQ76373.1 septum formation family protein [Saccharothrix sp. 6-C]